ncbi:Hypothetical predicted protein [Mytilus galloprovincialis]|uniref:Uncharacterized protein n=1 Tax=Mytilus galloprovincialis TaxID=29158 RepID=A0A8B6DBB6_MYTGA|nr:Hypothetical predicted protein [Mytilus galloprovincialis]
MASWDDMDEDIMASSDEDIMASWDEKLLTAAQAWPQEGNIKEVEVCVKNGANLECRDVVSKVKCLTHSQIFII